MACSITFSCLFLSLLSLSLSLSTALDLNRPSLAGGDVHDLLPRYGFPKGLLPDNVKSYTLSDGGDFTVDLNTPCYVDFPGQTVFYDKKIAGKLSLGSVEDVEGIKAKELFIWASITAMKSDQSSGNIVFSVGFVSKSLPASMFVNVPSCSKTLSLEASMNYNLKL